MNQSFTDTFYVFFKSFYDSAEEECSVVEVEVGVVQGSRGLIFIVENNKQLDYGQISAQEIRDLTVYQPESIQ